MEKSKKIPSSLEDQDKNLILISKIKDKALNLDYEVSSGLQKLRSKFGNYFWKAISFAGYPYIWAIVGVTFAIFDIFHVAYIIFFAGLSSLAVVLPIKNHYKRKRPYDTFGELTPLKKERKRDYSFPSGHTYNATVNGVALALCYGGTISLLLMIGLSIMVAVSRLYIGVHYFSDVAAGFLLGLAVAYILYLCFPLIMALHYLSL